MVVGEIAYAYENLLHAKFAKQNRARKPRNRSSSGRVEIFYPQNFWLFETKREFFNTYAFHENAVYVKTNCDFDVVFAVAFAVVLPKAYLSFLAEHFAERPGAVKGGPLFGAAQRTLDGEDRSATLPLGKEGGRYAFMLLV